MVDNGSVMPKLRLTTTDLKPSDVVIKAYDDTKRPVEGTFRVLVKTGPIETWVNLHVIDIPITFAILLGRPWFHSLGGVPSIVHQKIKFPHERRVVTITAETEATIAALKMGPQEIPVSLSFVVCMIYEDELDNKVVSIMRKINFMSEMGLEKN